MWNFDDPSPYEQLTDAMLQTAESHLGVRLPSDYIAALRSKNGGSITGQYVLLPEQIIPEHLSRYLEHSYLGVSGINGIGSSHQSIGQTPYMTEEWQLPSGLVLLDGDGHTWIAFDYRHSPLNPTIVFVESDSGDTLFIASTFTEFFSALVAHEELFDNNGDFRHDSINKPK